MNKWASDDEKLKWLNVRLTGKVRTALRKLPANVREKYGECLKALKQRFDPDSKKELYVVELHTHARRREEDWASYGDALRVLADKAYFDLEEKARERLALTQFLAHIEKPQVAFGVRQKRPEMVEAVVVATIELESYHLNTASSVQGGSSAVASLSVSAEPSLESLKLLNERLDKLEVLLVSKANTGARERRTALKGPPTCWNCGKKGHIARNCWTRQKQGQGNSNPSMAWANHEGEAI